MKLTEALSNKILFARGNFKVDPEKNIRSTCLKSDFTRWCYPTIEILIVRLKTLTDENEWKRD